MPENGYLHQYHRRPLANAARRTVPRTQQKYLWIILVKCIWFIFQTIA